MKSLKEYLPESFLVELGEGPGDSGSPISGSTASRKPDPVESKYGTRELKIGDPVIVKNMQHEGKHGIVDDFTDNNDYVIVEFKDLGKMKFNIADLEYDDYADKEEIDANHELNNLRILSGY